VRPDGRSAWRRFLAAEAPVGPIRVIPSSWVPTHSLADVFSKLVGYPRSLPAIQDAESWRKIVEESPPDLVPRPTFRPTLAHASGVLVPRIWLGNG